MSYSKEVNRYVFPLVATNLVQVLIGQISLHFAVDNSNAALSGISVIQNFFLHLEVFLEPLVCRLILEVPRLL